jgi:hypothetical protein
MLLEDSGFVVNGPDLLLTRHCFCLLKSRNTSATAKYPSLSASPMPTLRRVGKLVQVAGPGPEIRITVPDNQTRQFS